MGVSGIYQCEVMIDNDMQQKLRSYGIMKLYESDGMLKGSMFPPYFWLDSGFRDGKVDGNKFSYTVHWSTPCQQFSMDVEGEVNGDILTGKATTPVGTSTIHGVRVADDGKPHGR